jgi:hypothetical protein
MLRLNSHRRQCKAIHGSTRQQPTQLHMGRCFLQPMQVLHESNQNWISVQMSPIITLPGVFFNFFSIRAKKLLFLFRVILSTRHIQKNRAQFGSVC